MKITSILILILGVLIGGIIILGAGDKKQSTSSIELKNNVEMVGNKQVITINAKGGYSPILTTAKAGISTVIKMKTRGTFDCSSAVYIPILNYRENLPPSGEVSIDVPPQQVGTSMQGLCSMGMYNFVINFN
ncbi:MAG: cupredoxin domain-containing protein [Candidatus Pacebacteria bacterium]|jgi:plastocyanin domain-containing protein|nr:cupredoxin domain-containing protein [Candidatus Paceibacterota bacterium]